MKIKFENKINIIPITLYFIWCLFVLYSFIFQNEAFANETPCGAGYLMVGLPVFTIILGFLALILITILNVFCKRNFYTDYIFIAFIYFSMIICFSINILSNTLF